MVCIECAANFNFAVFKAMVTVYAKGVSVVFIAIIAIVLSSFLKAVASMLLELETLLILFAPGLILKHQYSKTQLKVKIYKRLYKPKTNEVFF